MLQNTADVAAHAGAAALYRGATELEAHDAALAAIQYNMPSSKYGTVINDPSQDIVLLEYNYDTNTISASGDKNAVAVTVHRSSLVGNQVRTFLLNLVGFAGLDAGSLSGWNINATGVAAQVNTRRCLSTDGIFARGQINLTASNAFGAGYCLHSQNEVWMPQENSFGERAGISMPDLADCGNKCTDEANPGSANAKFERNMPVPDLGLHTTSIATSFTATSSELRSDFFTDKSYDDGTALAEIGFTTSGLTTGSVVNMTQSQFMSLTSVPAGLTYNVTCTASGSGPNTRLQIDSGIGGNQLRDVAIVTNCALDFGSDANVSNSLIVTTRTSSNAVITASQGGFVGDNANNCSNNDKTTIMATGDMNVPANFVGSNVSFLVDGNINLAAASSSSSGTLMHFGTSLMATGEISIAANHSFNPCNKEPSGLMPALRVIRFVVPEGWHENTGTEETTSGGGSGWTI